MKTKLPRYLVAGALALAFSFTAAFAQEADAKKEKGPSKADLQKYDANKDGMLDESETAAAKAEKEAMRKVRLEKYDANKDGKINKEEAEVEKADREKAKAEKKAKADAKKSERAKQKAQNEN